MNIRLTQKKERLLQEFGHPHSRNEYIRRLGREHNKELTFLRGNVVDNKDPKCLGRLRISMNLFAPGSISPWYQVSKRMSGNGKGFWALPDIGTQVLVCFPYGNISRGVILGCFYDEKHRPPKPSTDNPVKSYLWQTKNHRIEIIDEEGKESITISTAKGKMRTIISKDEGIKIINELGDIKIKCRKLIIKAGKNVDINGSKKVSITCNDAMSIKAKKTIGISNDKEVTISGKNIKLSGTQGVTTEGKQIATQDDKVMGFDTHIMVIPSGPSTTTAPLPHPFIGKITDEISDDVKIKDKGVATKGSKAKHDDSMHMQLPGTIQFQNSPKCEGEVTGGTGSKVKVNGKEVAVIGSQVTTCNDMGMQNNSTIIAAGLSIPMPMILNPKNTEEFEREEKEQEDKEPKFKNVKWSVTSVEEDEEAELSACVEDICDGNMVTLQVFREGKGPENSDPMAQFPLIVKDGKVSAKWKYHADHTEPAPDQNPKFIFSAHSAWCNFEKSSNSLEVKLIRPEITKVEWQDADGNPVTKALVGDRLKLIAHTKDMEDGEGVTFGVYDSLSWNVGTIGATVKDGKAEAEWIAKDIRLPTYKKELNYRFTVKHMRIKGYSESDRISAKNPKVLSMEWDKEAIYYGDKATLKIKTFEFSDEMPTCKLQLWEKDYTSEDDFILEKDITIDKDEVETEIKIDFDIKKLLDEKEKELKLYPRLIYEDKVSCIKNSLLFVKIGGLRK